LGWIGSGAVTEETRRDRKWAIEPNSTDVHRRRNVSKAFALKIALLQVLVDAWFARDCPKPHPENDPWKR
jgi:hypothetical protein